MADAWRSALVRRPRRYRLPAPDGVVGSVVHTHSLADRHPACTECPRGCGARLVGGGGISGRSPLLAAAEHHGLPAGHSGAAWSAVAALGRIGLAAALWRADAATHRSRARGHPGRLGSHRSGPLLVSPGRALGTARR